MMGGDSLSQVSADLGEILEALALRVPAGTLATAFDYLEHFELGLALSELLWVVVDEAVPVTSQERLQIERLAYAMGIEDELRPDLDALRARDPQPG